MEQHTAQSLKDHIPQHQLKTRMIIRSFLFVLLVFYLGVYAVSSYYYRVDAKKVPPMPKGHSHIFSAEMSWASRISQIDTTDDHIYFAYDSHNAVAVYNWDGEYQYSISFYNGNNNVFRIRCKDGLLYVYNRANYEFVFSSSELIAVYDPDNRIHFNWWYNEERSVPLIIENKKVYDAEGKYIMDLPGRY